MCLVPTIRGAQWPSGIWHSIEPENCCRASLEISLNCWIKKCYPGFWQGQRKPHASNPQTDVKVVGDRVAHRYDWWGSLDSVWQRETLSRATGIWLGFHSWLPGLWLQICRLWEFPLRSSAAFVLFNSITRHLFALWQCQIFKFS